MRSYLSWWASSVNDPKARLASYLAKVLSVFFVGVDANWIESNLLTDARIVLHDIRMRPCQLDPTHCLTSHVDEMELQWTWGGAENGSTSFVREISLTVRGVRIRVSFVDKDESASLMHVKQSSVESILAPSDSSGTTLPGVDHHHEQTYVEWYIQQIIDHIKLQLTDMELTIETLQPTASADAASSKRQETIAIHAQALEFVSFGREKAEPMSLTERMKLGTSEPPKSPSALLQRIALKSLSADLQVLDEQVDKVTKKETLPILQPFGYAASVLGDAGRRFFDGDWMSGVKVVGEESDGLTLCVGSKQVQSLERLLVSFFGGAKEENHPDSILPKGKVGGFTDAQATGEAFCDEEWSSSSPSILEMPFPSISLVFPNGSSLQMPDCRVHYRTDWSQFYVSGSKGIRVGDGHFDFLELCGESTRWVVDFVKRSFVLEDLMDKDDVSNAPEVFYDAQQEFEVSSGIPQCVEREFKVVVRLHWHEHVKHMIYGFLQTV